MTLLVGALLALAFLAAPLAAEAQPVAPIPFRLMDRIAADERREASVLCGGLVAVQRPTSTNRGRPLS